MGENEFHIDNINNYILKQKKKLNKEIGEKLKERRREKNISLIELSEQTNTSPTYISQIERGEYSISLFKFILFCNSLEMNIFHFLDEFIFNENSNEEVLFSNLQKNKNIADNILEYMKEKDNH